MTCGGRGMGAAIAREKVARGYAPVLMSPSESCETLARKLGGVARRGVAQSAEDLKGIVDLAMATHCRIDAVLNHTGHPPKGDLLAITDDNWDLANDLIAKSVVRMARPVPPVMDAQGSGSVVNVTTYASLEPSLWFPASCVYRAGVQAFARLYADHHGPAGIRMNSLAPGFTDSLDVAKYGELAALKRIASVKEQAKAAAYLLTDDSSYVTGQTLIVDGGLTRSI